MTRYFENSITGKLTQFPNDRQLVTFYIALVEPAVQGMEPQYALRVLPTSSFQVIKQCPTTHSDIYIPVNPKQAEAILKNDSHFDSNNPQKIPLFRHSIFTLLEIKTKLGLKADQDLPEGLPFNDRAQSQQYAEEKRDLPPGQFSDRIKNPVLGKNFSVPRYQPRQAYYTLVNDCIGHLQTLLAFSKSMYYVDENYCHDTSLEIQLQGLMDLLKSQGFIKDQSYDDHLMLPIIGDERVFQLLLALAIKISNDSQYRQEDPSKNLDVGVLKGKLNSMSDVFKALGNLDTSALQSIEPFKVLIKQALDKLIQEKPMLSVHRSTSSLENFFRAVIPYCIALIKNLCLLLPPVAVYRALNKPNTNFFFSVETPEFLKTKSERFVTRQEETLNRVLNFDPNPSLEEYNGPSA